jgi:hypothetical protein
MQAIKLGLSNNIRDRAEGNGSWDWPRLSPIQRAPIIGPAPIELVPHDLNVFVRCLSPEGWELGRLRPRWFGREALADAEGDAHLSHRLPQYSQYECCRLDKNGAALRERDRVVLPHA